MFLFNHIKFLIAFALFTASLTNAGAQTNAVFESEQQRFKAQVEQNGTALQSLLHNDLY